MANQGPLALAREIDELRKQFEQISTDADTLVTPLGQEQFVWRPGPNRWSIAECLEHMNATARFYLPAIDEGIADAIRNGAYAEGPFKYNLIGRIFSHLMEPPARFRMRAAIDKMPGPQRPKRETLAARGHRFQKIGRKGELRYGFASGALIDEEHGQVEGGADPRRSHAAVALESGSSSSQQQ